jgi:excisionase family DNA binding protein
MTLKRILYRINEIAEMTGLSPKTLYQWATERRFPSYKSGGVVLVNYNEFMAFLEKDKREAKKVKMFTGSGLTDDIKPRKGE